MLGLMQDWPLLCHRVLDHAKIQHGARPVISRSIEGPVHRSTYAEIHQRSLQVAQALDRLGIRPGDRIGTFAWNTWRHLEVWYGVLGVGAIYHTINPRLFTEQIDFIVNHAEDRLIFTDLTFVPLLESLQDRFPSVERYIVLTDREHMPDTSLKEATCYEDWIGEADGDFAWREVDERSAAGMCYTSGTTGKPKGVIYSHRSNVLHALAANGAGALSLSASDIVMPVVPMFHANGWILPFAAPLTGAALVLPGMKLDGAGLYEMLDAHKVTFTAAVPTLWFMLLQHLEESGGKLPNLDRVMIGGAACPRSVTQIFKEKYGVNVVHGWGMTETSPIGTLCTIKPEYAHLSDDEKLDLQVKAGHPFFTVELKITDDEGNRLPWDGETPGRLKVRGPAVSSAYFKGEGGDILDAEGFFDTGDVATIDEYGYIQITDRSKDVIKSGGEWISSIDIENAAVGHPGVAEAAVIGIAHEKWGERPLLIVVARQDDPPGKEEILEFLRGRLAKWTLPDDVVFVDEIPHTATGKILKTRLREDFADFSFGGGKT